MLKGPDALPELNLPIISITSSTVQGFRKMVFGLVGLRYDLKDVLTLLILASTLEPMLTKKLYLFLVLVVYQAFLFLNMFVR